MFRNLYAGKTEDDPIVISDDESMNAGGASAVPKAKAVPTKKCTKCKASNPIRVLQCTICNELFTIKGKANMNGSASPAGSTGSSPLNNGIKHGRKRPDVGFYKYPDNFDLLDPTSCTVCANKRPNMGPNGPKMEKVGHLWALTGCFKNCKCQCHHSTV